MYLDNDYQFLIIGKPDIMYLLMEEHNRDYKELLLKIKNKLLLGSDKSSRCQQLQEL